MPTNASPSNHDSGERPPHSILEFTVLGIAWSKGCCTTYAIMKELADSPSTFYRSSAGTVYPIVRRLIKEGLLEREGLPGRRQDSSLRLTEEGKRRLDQWMTPPIPVADIEHTVDLVRLRFFFLGALAPDQRIAFIDSVVPGLQQHLAKSEAVMRTDEALGKYVEAMAGLGIVYEARARIAWLEDVRTRLLQGG